MVVIIVAAFAVTMVVQQQPTQHSIAIIFGLVITTTAIGIEHCSLIVLHCCLGLNLLGPSSLFASWHWSQDYCQLLSVLGRWHRLQPLGLDYQPAFDIWLIPHPS